MKEFFEAFNLSEWTDCCTNEDVGYCEYQTSNKCTNRECWNNCNFAIDGYFYPPITSDIVLGLEEIIIDKFGDIYWDKKAIHKDGHQMYRCKCTLKNDEIQAMWAIGTTKKEALLDLCIYLKNDDIKYQVRELFNAK